MPQRKVIELSKESKTTLRGRATRIGIPTALPSADTAAKLFRALLASGRIAMRKVDRRRTLATKPDDHVPALNPGIDLAA